MQEKPNFASQKKKKKKKGVRTTQTTNSQEKKEINDRTSDTDKQTEKRYTHWAKRVRWGFWTMNLS